jgi:hypothetical protein
LLAAATGSGDHEQQTMGIRCLARAPSLPITTLEQRLSALGAVPIPECTRWWRQCIYQLPRNAEMGLHELFVLRSSEDADGEQHIVHRTRAARPAAEGDAAAAAAAKGDDAVRVLRAGAEIATVLTAMQTHTQRLKVEIEGSAHACGDFVVRIGQLFVNQGALAGVAVELEYLPCALASAAASNAPLHAFLDLLLTKKEHDFSSSTHECFRGACDLPRAFGPEHNALLFVGLMQKKLLSGAAPSAGGGGGGR